MIGKGIEKVAFLSNLQKRTLAGSAIGMGVGAVAQLVNQRQRRGESDESYKRRRRQEMMKRIFSGGITGGLAGAAYHVMRPVMMEADFNEENIRYRREVEQDRRRRAQDGSWRNDPGPPPRPNARPQPDVDSIARRIVDNHRPTSPPPAPQPKKTNKDKGSDTNRFSMLEID